ncbi:MAG: glycine--tRNA ligase subunit beta [Fimbriimonas sp.]
MAEFLLEVGCEELPATFVRKAQADLLGLLTQALREANILLGEGRSLATPRRLVVGFADLRDRQEDVQKDVRGPAVKAAFDADGKPTGALLGFCRGQGVSPDSVRHEGDYAWITKLVPGRETREILAEVVPQAIRALTFEKSMRWGASRMRFARPIRWILCAFDGQVVPFEIEGVASGTSSRGHRFYASEAFEAKNWTELTEGLVARKVEADASLRRERILAGVAAVATGKPELSESLIEENTYLTEWPTAIAGHFREEFMGLPEPVLVIAMAKHERMFPVRGDDGRLTNQFVFIRNSGEDETVQRGSQWVLNARFNDAKFFFDEDKKVTFDGFLAKTSGILFQEKLGTVRQRADRLASLTAEIARATGASDEEVEFARLAGLYAKADLSTGLVSELSSLQGIIGGEYAKREGFPEAVCAAIRDQYNLGAVPAEDTASSRTALRLIMADQLDKLAGYLGLGLSPTGSSDPFGLRRAVTLLIEAAWAWPSALPPCDQMMEFAMAEYRKQPVALDDSAAFDSLTEIFRGRYPALMGHFRHDILDAAMLAEMRWELTMPRSVRLRAEVLREVSADVALVQTATRPLNIVAAAKKKGISYGWDDPLRQVIESDLASAEGLALLAVLRDQEEAVFVAAREGQADVLLASLRNLSGPISDFFEKTMVMVDEEATRFARLTLLHAAALQVLAIGDVSKLVIEG